MHLNAIRVCEKNSQVVRLYRLSKGANDKQRCISIKLDDPKEIDLVKDAFEFAFNGKYSALVEEAAFHYNDQNGFTWILRSSITKTEVLKNGSEATLDDFFVKLQQGIASTDTPIVSVSDLEIDGSEITKTYTSATNKLDLYPALESLKKELCTTPSEFDGSIGLNDLKEFIALDSKQKNLSDLRSKLNSSAQQSPVDGIQLQKELQIIASIRIHLDQIKKTELKIPEIQKELSSLDSKLSVYLNSKSGFLSNGNLPEAFRIFFEQIQTENTAKLLQSEINQEKLFQEFLGNLKQRMKATKQEAKEAQETSETESEDHSAINQIMLTWFDKFKAKKDQTSGEEGDLSFQVVNSKAQLQNYKEVVTELFSLTEEKQSLGKHTLKLKHNKLQKTNQSLQALKAKWTSVSRQLGLTSEKKLPQFLTALRETQKLSQLMESRAKLLATLNTRKSHLDSLMKLILEWRASVKSIKKNDLSNASIIIAEANSILNYEKERLKSLESIQLSSAERRVKALLLSKIETELDGVEQTRTTLLHKLGADTQTPIDETRQTIWLNHLAYAQIEAAFAKSQSSPQPQDSAIEVLNLGALSPSVEQLHNMLNLNDNSPIKIILTTNTDLAKASWLEGFGRGIKVIRKPQNSGPKIVDNKVMETLNILRGNPASSTFEDGNAREYRKQ